jgi:hypothetical protein
MRHLILATILIGLAQFAPATASEATNRTPQVFGDFRLRHEYQWLEGVDLATGDIEDLDQVTRDRIRVRVGVKAAITDNLDYTIGLATGPAKPTATNATLDGSFSTKSIGLDLGFITWTLPFDQSGNVKAVAGKMRNPFFRSGGNQLMWDSDVTPEGFVLSYGSTKGEKSSIFATSSLLWVEENSTADDIFLVAAQAGPQIQLGSGGSLAVGGGYYYYSSKYVGGDWAPIEGFIDLTLKAAGHPVQVYGDVFYNHKANNEKLAWIAGTKIGLAAPLSIGYSYRILEANSLPESFIHSDFAGGESDSKGHSVVASVKLAPDVTLNSIFQLNERDTATTKPIEFMTLQFNLSVKF